MSPAMTYIVEVPVLAACQAVDVACAVKILYGGTYARVQDLDRSVISELYCTMWREQKRYRDFNTIILHIRF